jgi:hypothetical protein
VHLVAQRATLVGSAIAVLACASPSVRTPATDPNALEWIQLFNGRDLEDWTPKFAGHPVGANVHGTFRVDGGLLTVRYDAWPAPPAEFRGEFGHLFYKRRAFSHYVVAVEYRFVGEQLPSAAATEKLGWAVRNNGVMVHAQASESMTPEQDFPVSIEVQLLGGLGDGRARPTANLCTPGTHVVLDGVLVTRHCTSSRSKTFDGDQWVRVEALVLGDSVIKHMANGDTVLSYAKPQRDDGRPLTRGYIALQAETAPVEFRKVELLNLEGCTDPEALTYKRYLVKADSTACYYAARPAAKP